MKLSPQLLIVAGLLIAGTAARAQVTGTVQQVDTAGQHRQHPAAPAKYPAGATAPELYPEEGSDVGPQSVLRLNPRRTWFQATADVQYFYTDNMFLTEGNRHGVDVLVSTADFALAPTPYELWGGMLSPRLGYEHQWFDFSLANSDRSVSVFDFNTATIRSVPLSKFDFNVQTIYADVQWSPGNWMWDAGFDFRRMMSTSSYDEFYTEYVPRWGLRRVFPLGDNTAIVVGYEGDYRFGDPRPVVFTPPFPPVPVTIDPDMHDRTDHSLFVTYSQPLSSHTLLEPYYRAKFTHFTDSPAGRRNDLLNSFGVALYWAVCPNFEVRGFVDYNIRSSDSSAVSEYRQLDAGGGVNLTFRF
jgi:hypothetical protein